ncbi:MAG: endolytic transglycosylase MltG, partial [Clostridia bacterium]|nr:endolytic transglycosylase MltG [Clostridia bacterium]
KGQIPDDLFEEEETASAGPAPEEPAAAPERDEFVIGSGFNLGTDYEARARRSRGMDKPPVVKKQEVDLKKIKQEQRREEKKKKHAKFRWLKILIWLVVIFAVAGAFAWGVIVAGREVLGMNKDGIYQVVVEPGMTTTQIADRLQEEGVIDYPLLFRVYLKLKGRDGTLRHGAYQLNMATVDGYDGIINILQKGNEKKTVTVRIPEAANVQTIGRLLEENGVCKYDDFRKAMKSNDYTYDFVKAIPTDMVYYRMEGYLYPDTYDFFTCESESESERVENAKLAIDRMLDNFDKHLKKIPDLQTMLKALKTYGISSLHDALSLASIVQMECDGYPDQMPNVAAVFLGRLVWSEPKYLGSTPTYYYPDNRYNTNSGEMVTADGRTYKAGYEGLPPGPQSCVTLDALKAVLNPNIEYIGKYYYFVTDTESNFYYNETYSKHKNTINRLVREGKWGE